MKIHSMLCGRCAIELGVHIEDRKKMFSELEQGVSECKRCSRRMIKEGDILRSFVYQKERENKWLL